MKWSLLRALYLISLFLFPNSTQAAKYKTDTDTKSGPEQTRAAVDEAASQLLTAHGLLERGLFDLAITEYRAFLEKNEDHTEVNDARYGLALCFFRQGEFAEALAALEPLSDVDEFPSAAEVALMLARSRLALGEAEGALEALNGLRSVRGWNKTHALADDVLMVGIEASYALGRFDHVTQLAERLRESYPASEWTTRAAYYTGLAAMALGRYEQAATNLTDLRDQETDAQTASHVDLLLAQSLEQIGQLEKAAPLYRKVLGAGNESFTAPARLGLARILRSQRELQAAWDIVEPLLDEESESAPGLRQAAQLLAGRVAFEGQDPERALRLFASAGQGPQEGRLEASFWSGMAHMELGKFVEAADAFARTVDRGSESEFAAEARFNQAAALLQAQQTDEADKQFAVFLDEHPDHDLSGEALYQRALLAHQSGNHDTSSERCKSILVDYSTSPRARDAAFLLAENAFLARDYTSALALYTAFAEHYAEDARASTVALRAGMAAYRLEDWQTATQWLERLPLAPLEEPGFAPALFALGDMKFARSEWKSAAQDLARFVEASPESTSVPDALLKIGLARQKSGDPVASLAAIDELLERFPESTLRRRALFERGQLLVRAGDDDKARKAFEAVLESDDDDDLRGYALYQLGNLAARHGESDKASSYQEQAIERLGSEGIAADATLEHGLTLLSAKRYNEAETQLGKFLARFENHPQVPMAAAQLALAIAGQERWEEAVTAVDRVIQRHAGDLDPALHVQILYEKAWAQRQLDKPIDAASTYKQLLSVASNDAPLASHAALELAELRVEAGDIDAAVDLLQPFDVEGACPTKVPTEVCERALYRLAWCDFTRKDWSAADQRLERFLERFPNSPLAHSAQFYRGESQYQSGQMNAAVASFRSVIESSAKEAAEFQPGLLRLGECLAAIQEWSASEKVMRDYLEQFPDDPLWFQARFGIGWACENDGRLDEAIAAYQPVAERHTGPTAARAQFQIGQCLFAQNKLNEAVRELLKVDILHSYPQWSAAALFEAGRCLAKLNKITEARLQMEAVVERFPESEWAASARQQLNQLAGSTLPGR